MKRPTYRSNLPVIPDRPVYEWINQVNRKQNEFSTIRLTHHQRESVARWTESEMARAARQLDPESGHEADWAAAFSIVRQLGTGVRPDAALTVDTLEQMNDLLFGRAAGSRSSTGIESAERVEIALRWFAAESFLELHPVEQTAIALLRLIEIQPFPAHNQGAALIAASLFTIRAGLPPPILRSEQLARYRAAVQEGLKMSTQPMVELIADAIAGAFGQMKTIVEAQ